MKKTMRKSALLSSVAMLIVSAIVLTSATYAWFSSSKVVTVENLTAEVKVSTGLLVSVDKGVNWGTNVNFATAAAVKTGWGTGIPKTLDPVSSADGNTWKSAIYDEDTDTLNFNDAVVGTQEGDMVAVPFWVTGPVGETVTAKIDFGATTAQTASCLKFALLPADATTGETVTSYTEAVAATLNADSKFMGVSAAGTTAASGAYVTDGGTEITELAANGGLTFPIAEGTTMENPMKFIAFIWLEGNDADCDMTLFKGTQTVNFKMEISIP